MNKALPLIVLVFFLFGAWTMITKVRSMQKCYTANTERYEEIAFKRQTLVWDNLKACEERVYTLEDLTQCIQKVEKSMPIAVAKQMMGMVTEFVRLTRGGLPLIAEYKKVHNEECGELREYFVVQ